MLSPLIIHGIDLSYKKYNANITIPRIYRGGALGEHVQQTAHVLEPSLPTNIINNVPEDSQLRKETEY